MKLRLGITEPNVYHSSYSPEEIHQKVKENTVVLSDEPEEQPKQIDAKLFYGRVQADSFMISPLDKPLRSVNLVTASGVYNRSDESGSEVRLHFQLGPLWEIIMAASYLLMAGLLSVFVYALVAQSGLDFVAVAIGAIFFLVVASANVLFKRAVNRFRDRVISLLHLHNPERAEEVQDDGNIAKEAASS